MRLLITFFAIFIISNSYCQEWYTPEDQWIINTFDGLSGYDGYAIMSFDKDTIINGIDCKRMRLDEQGYSRQLSDSVFYTKFEHFYQEDKKLYFFQDFEFKLNYDFGLQPGDSLKFLPAFCQDSITYHLDSLGTINIGNESLTVQHFSFTDINWDYTGTRTVIEKIGAVDQGLNIEAPHVCLFDLPISDICIYTNGIDSLQLQSGTCNGFLVNTKELIENFDVNIYPNPVIDNLNIKSTDPIEQLQIFDSSGRLILLSPFKKNIDCSSLSSGRYFIKLIDGKKVKVLSFFK